MRYVEFRDLILKELKKHPEGFTWKELRDRLNLPYKRPCPEWTKRLEKEIGFIKEGGNKKEHISGK